jgi:hypothetical protein
VIVRERVVGKWCTRKFLLLIIRFAGMPRGVMVTYRAHAPG